MSPKEADPCLIPCDIVPRVPIILLAHRDCLITYPFVRHHTVHRPLSTSLIQHMMHKLGNTEHALESQVGQHWPNPVSPEPLHGQGLAVSRVFLQVSFEWRSRASLCCPADFGHSGWAHRPSGCPVTVRFLPLISVKFVMAAKICYLTRQPFRSSSRVRVDACYEGVSWIDFGRSGAESKESQL